MALLHPIFPLLIRRPDLIIDHLGGYLALVRQEASQTGVGLARRGIAWGIVVFLLAVFVALAGGAVMLGVLLDRFSWVLIVVPAVVLAAIAGALAVALQPMKGAAFAELEAQFEADRQTLRAASSGDPDDAY